MAQGWEPSGGSGTFLGAVRRLHKEAGVRHKPYCRTSGAGTVSLPPGSAGGPPEARAPGPQQGPAGLHVAFLRLVHELGRAARSLGHAALSLGRAPHSLGRGVPAAEVPAVSLSRGLDVLGPRLAE